MKEPQIKVGIIDRTGEIKVRFSGTFRLRQTNALIEGAYRIGFDPDGFFLAGAQESGTVRARCLVFYPEENGTFSIKDVRIGINFHWDQMEDQTFRGELILVHRGEGLFAVINGISLEDYLISVISSEMGAAAPVEFLKAHAIASRSWLAAMLEYRPEDGAGGAEPRHEIATDDSILRWYDREAHDLFDVCADDHCQRYQGITKVISANAVRAVRETNGVFLIFRDENGAEEICDARFSKACGGLTESYSGTWDERSVPYLQEISDSIVPCRAIRSEEEAGLWFSSRPDVFCNASDRNLLVDILPAFDRETEFFRWKVEYGREELEEILRKKSGIDFGRVLAITPVERGLSGRIRRLRIEGSLKKIIVGKELEIRRWLSRTHLLSSAFVIDTETGPDGIPERFILTGAGWGHGVGMCQIGAAMMAVKGFKSEEILRHYFPGTELKKWY